MIVRSQCVRCGRAPVVSLGGLADIAREQAALKLLPAAASVALGMLASDLDCHAERCVARPRTPSQERPLP